MKPTMRPYQTEDDYWRIRAFLREVFLLNDRRELSWQAARLDYWRWHVVENCHAGDPPIEQVTFIWETVDSQIAAVLNPEGKADAHLQVHPAWRTPELEEEMIAVAEERLGQRGANGKRKLCLWANARDDMRQSVLARRGFHKGDWPEYQRRRSLDAPIPDAPLAPGYTVRALGDVDELPARSWVSWRAFHPDEPDENYEGWEWYHNIQRIPLYRRDLDIVAVAPDGEFAAFCTVWYDDVTRTGYFEPVGVAPEHQRKGLGRAVMTEAMRRLQRLGATLATVGGYSTAANALYGSVMSPEYELSEPWTKEPKW
jgi:ribosomal protein S18 acetylase RimI-like enzyme